MRFLRGALFGSVATLAALLWARTRQPHPTAPAEGETAARTDRFPAAFRQWVDESQPLDDPVAEVVREMEVALV